MKTSRLLAFTVLAATVSIGSAHASMNLSGTFNISVYQGAGGGNINAAESQANLANPLLNDPALYTGTYTGDICFTTLGNNSNNILDFLLSAGGALSGDTSALNTTLSTGSFALTTLVDLTWTGGSLEGTIDHDDGVTLYRDGGVVVDSSFPTSPIETTFASPTGGDYQLIYAAANGLPEVLCVSVVPEVTSLLVWGAMLIPVGLVVRRSYLRKLQA